MFMDPKDEPVDIGECTCWWLIPELIGLFKEFTGWLLDEKDGLNEELKPLPMPPML